MSIVKVTSPQAAPLSLTDWQAAVSQIEKLYLGVELPLRIDYDNDIVFKGSVFQIGGSVYIADSDTSISGTPSDYVKITPSGSTATASYVANLTGVTWNDTYNGYYDGSGNIHIFDEMKAILNEDISAVNKLQGQIGSNVVDYANTRLSNYSVKSRFENSAIQLISASGSWQTAILNTDSYNNIQGASRSGSIITLPSGKYEARIGAVCLRTDYFAVRFYNSSDALAVSNSQSQSIYSSNISGGQTLFTTSEFYFEITSSKNFVIQFYATASSPNTAYIGANTSSIPGSAGTTLDITRISD